MEPTKLDTEVSLAIQHSGADHTKLSILTAERGGGQRRRQQRRRRGKRRQPWRTTAADLARQEVELMPDDGCIKLPAR